MIYRKQIDSTDELAAWYDNKYREMGGCWETPADHANRHLDDLGVPFDHSKLLLDVGCGGGHFLKEASRRVMAIGMEISREAIRYCAESNLIALYGSIEDVGVGNPVFDYIVSNGSLEHVVDLDAALANVRTMLLDDGKWYFYVPNELWIHEDQPNERTMPDEEWCEIFTGAGLEIEHNKRWNDSTAFWGGKA